MTARILVIESNKLSRKLLTESLQREYYEAVQADSIPAAQKCLSEALPDLVVMDFDFPDNKTVDFCTFIKTSKETSHIPIIVLSAPSDDINDRRASVLSAGVEDFMVKPIQDIGLVVRVRSLLRLKSTLDELKMRGSIFGGIDDDGSVQLSSITVPQKSKILVIDDQANIRQGLKSALSTFGEVSFLTNFSAEGILEIKDHAYDLIFVSLSMRKLNGLIVCSRLRQYEETKHIPVVAMTDQSNQEYAMKALEIGVSDYIVRPISKNEFVQRTRSQLRIKNYIDIMTESIRNKMQMATTDQLTGLNNRHYLSTYLDHQIKKSKETNKPLCLMLVDADHFKGVNDNFSHANGDLVLVEISERIRRNIRDIDFAARAGGEEFIIVMPNTPIHAAEAVAERLRKSIASSPIPINVKAAEDIYKGAGGIPLELNMTVSIGLSQLSDKMVSGEELIEMADKGLYRSKETGRNKVTMSHAA